MIFYLILWRSIVLSLAYEDSHKGRCARNVTIKGNVFLQEHYCCRHYVEQNKECVECPDGFTSDDGVHCIKCKNGYYGRRCADICNCDVNRKNQSNKRNAWAFGRKNTRINVQILKIYYISTPTRPITTDAETAPTRSSIATDAETGILGTVIGLIGIILIPGICYYCRRYRKRSLYKKSLAKADLTNSTNEIVELNDRIYHLIDESKMVDLNTHINTYLEVVESSTDSDSIPSTNEIDASCYLHPYNSVLADTEIHAYEKCRSDSQISKGPVTTDNAKGVDDDYWRPCQSFKDISEADYNDECKTTIVVVHRSESSSSETESDIDERACSGYLSPLPDNENVYDISVLGSISETGSDGKNME